MDKPFLLSKTFFPTHEENKLSSEGNAKIAREMFLKNRPRNLNSLLNYRYGWMNEYIKPNTKGIEIGCGSGLSKLYLKDHDYLLTDYEEHEWIDKKVDALNMPFEDSSLDYIILCQVLHHLSHPSKFFKEANRVLKPGGLLLVQDVYASLFTRFMLYVVKHEGYSFDVNPFNENEVCNDPRDPWSANTALSRLLFREPKKFEQNFSYSVKVCENMECLSLPLSGGVYAKTKVPLLSNGLLKLLVKFDSFIAKLFPRLLATGIKVVLVNNSKEA